MYMWLLYCFTTCQSDSFIKPGALGIYYVFLCLIMWPLFCDLIGYNELEEWGGVIPVFLPLYVIPQSLTHISNTSIFSSRLPVYLHSCLPHWMPDYLPVCLAGWLPACLPAFLTPCVPSSLIALLNACLSACLPSSLPACLPASNYTVLSFTRSFIVRHSYIHLAMICIYTLTLNGTFVHT